MIERAFRAVQRHRFLREFSWDAKTSKPIAVEFDPKEANENVLIFGMTWTAATTVFSRAVARVVTRAVTLDLRGLTES